ncbi:MAG TPA: RhuM family protein [Thermoguttaceae bacterium]|nr:RhuM family protein [Thermoguttaceae bacterium]
MADQSLPADRPPEGEFLLYRTEDGRTRIECRFAGESLWLSQADMAELFQVTVPTVNEHLKNLYEEGEIEQDRTIRNFRIVRQEGVRQVTRQIEHYSLDAILAIGYRVRSPRGTQFRVWATDRLREYLVKGFAMDDARLKRAGGGGYFEELLARIRDIRSSERVFWRKVLDIYATSIDYDPKVETSVLFFQTVQNKMHWAAHGHTAAEIVHARTDASRPNMGLMSWAGDRLRKTDVAVAKNYLHADEIESLNRIVSAYLEFAELQALRRHPMTMTDWIAKLDDFLKLSDREVLDHAGRISHVEAQAKAEAEYEVYCRRQAALPQPVDEHFAQSLETLKQIECRHCDDRNNIEKK